MNNFLQKIKWWQVGILIGLGLGLATLLPILSLADPHVYVANNLIAFYFQLPVMPIFLLVRYFLDMLPFYFTHNVMFAVSHLIGWTLGGIFYAYILKGWISRRKTIKKKILFIFLISISWFILFFMLIFLFLFLLA